ncbi:MAG: ECF-type sigma factor [Gemmatimonadota bacterium]
MTAPVEEITRLLVSFRGGDRSAFDRLLSLVYNQLHAMAHYALGPQGRDPTLGTTALVHEAFLKLHERGGLSLNDRKHFFAVASLAMRQIVIDDARRRSARKRGGDRSRVDLDTADLPIRGDPEDILALNEALSRLCELDERLGRVVELRYFGGLSVEETAEVLEVDPRTVKRDWRKARAILFAALRDTRLE